MCVSVPGVCSILEQINSQYSNKVARNVVLPIPLKKDMKSQPVHTYIACIRDGHCNLGMKERSGSSVKAEISACTSRRRTSNEEKELSRTRTLRFVPAINGKPM